MRRNHDLPTPSQRTAPSRCSNNTSGGREWFNGEAQGAGSVATATGGVDNQATVKGDNSSPVMGHTCSGVVTAQ